MIIFNREFRIKTARRISSQNELGFAPALSGLRIRLYTLNLFKMLIMNPSLLSFCLFTILIFHSVFSPLSSVQLICIKLFTQTLSQRRLAVEILKIIGQKLGLNPQKARNWGKKRGRNLGSNQAGQPGVIQANKDLI